jgi:hypothetical protein
MKEIALFSLSVAMPIAAFVYIKRQFSKSWWSAKKNPETTGVIFIFSISLISGFLATIDYRGIDSIYIIFWWTVFSGLLGFVFSQNWGIRDVWFFDIPLHSEQANAAWQEAINSIDVIRSGTALPKSRTILFDSPDEIPAALYREFSVPTRRGVIGPELAALFLISNDVADKIAAHVGLTKDQHGKLLECLSAPNILS